MLASKFDTIDKRELNETSHNNNSNHRGRSSKKKSSSSQLRKSSSSNLLNVNSNNNSNNSNNNIKNQANLNNNNNNNNENTINSGGKKPGEPLANVNKAFINFMNNTFDDLKRKNRRSTLQKSLSKENERILTSNNNNNINNNNNNVVQIADQYEKSSEGSESDDEDIKDALEDPDDESDDTFDMIEEAPLMDHVRCSCQSHPSRELLNRVFNLSFDTVYQSMFTRSEFLVKFWRDKKFRNVDVGDWSEDMRRTQVCELDLGTFGVSKNHEEQRMIENRPHQCVVVESETNSTGVMYAEYFSTTTRVCLTRVTATSTRLMVHMQINYKKQPNFIVKNLIDKTSFSNMKDCYNYLEKAFLEMDPAVEAVAPVLVSQQRRTANTNTNTMKNTTTNRMSMKSPRGSSKQQQQQHHFDRSMSDNVNRFVRTTSGGGLGGVGNVNTNLHDISSSSLSTTGAPVPPSVPSSSVHIDLYLVNIFKWRVRQDTFIKLVLILFLIIVAINIRLYLKLLYAENKMEMLRHFSEKEAPLLVDCGVCQQNVAKSWRSLVTSSLQALKNVETFLKDWETRFHETATME